MSRRDNRKNTPKKELRDLSPEAKRRAALLVGNTLILTFIYFGTMGLNEPLLSFIVTAGYWLIFAVFGLIYVIYNRAFTRRGVTADMLPDNWSNEKKQEYIADGESRAKSSKWMLTVIIPIMIPIALDAIYLFTLPIIQRLFDL